MGCAKHYVFCALVALAASTANASPVIYDFSASSAMGGSPFGSFTYTAPSLIASNQTVPAISLDTCVVTFPGGELCGPMTFYTDTSSLEPGGVDLHDAILFSVASGVGTFYYFVNGALSAPGVYNTVVFGEEQAATLTIRSTDVPEPATLALLGIGLAGLGFSRRKQ